MNRAYPILHVPADARIGEEPMGTKAKFWWQDAQRARWLFKYSRPGTGEHWAEKIAAEVGQLIGLPTAAAELAECGGVIGCAVLSFLPGRTSSLVHGNELLVDIDATYPRTQLRRVEQHTVPAALDVLRGVDPPLGAHDELPRAAEWFVGYLMLDALIGNGDRHHENWGVVQISEPAQNVRRLAPSYDHASSLGRELRDLERHARLEGRDERRTVRSYLDRARSAFFPEAGGSRPLHPVAAFRAAAALEPRAGEVWLARLRGVREDELQEVVLRVPEAVMSDGSRAFAIELMRRARRLLIAEESDDGLA